MNKDNQILEEITSKEYEHGWTVDLETDTAPKGLDESTVRFISKRKNEPEWLLEWRLNAFRTWIKMKEPVWPNVKYPAINYQDIIYYSAPKQKVAPKNLEDIDPEMLRTFEKLGISLTEQSAATGNRPRK